MKFRLVESFLDVDIDKDGLIKDTAGNVIGSTKVCFGNSSGSTAKGENQRQGEQAEEQGEQSKEQDEGQDSESKQSEQSKEEEAEGEKESENEKDSENGKESKGQRQLKPSQGRKGKGNGPQIKNDGKLYHDPRYTGTWKFKVSDEDSEKYKLKPEDQFYDAKVDDSKYGDIYDRY